MAQPISDILSVLPKRTLAANLAQHVAHDVAVKFLSDGDDPQILSRVASTRHYTTSATHVQASRRNMPPYFNGSLASTKAETLLISNVLKLISSFSRHFFYVIVI
jgi:hypothetical protein